MKKQHCFNDETRRAKNIALGVVFIAAGSAFLLRNLEYLSDYANHIIFSWPMLIMAVGFVKLFGNNKLTGLLFLIAGGIFMVPLAMNMEISFSTFILPVILVIIGIGMLTKSSGCCWNAKAKMHINKQYDDFTEETNK